MKKKILIINANYYKDISDGLLFNALKIIPKISKIKIIKKRKTIKEIISKLEIMVLVLKS